MKKTLIVITIAAALLLLAGRTVRHALANSTPANQPAYLSDGKLALPANYREWTFLTSGFGMNYSTGANSRPLFTNVYVTPEAYQGFKSTGKWPDKSMFIVEIYSPASHGSINKGGHYQDAFVGLDIEVKDSSRPQEWSYYNFGPGETTGQAVGAGCNTCHNKNGAVEHTFVQFYPTLLDFAMEKNLIKPGVSIPLNQSRFLAMIRASGWEKAEQAYYDDKKKNPDSDLLDESALNTAGYRLLGEKDSAGAIKLFELVTKNYPNSVNAVDSLADAYVQGSQPQLARAASEKEMALAKNDSSLSPEQKKQFTELAQKRLAAIEKQ
jgi:tetratricopeptide (TPR) repeat protein